ncbi:MAG: hypothetical protein JNK89_04870, partial [Saprospiraceae bacterium]|nr:hypothetical protein [Saprospiraceae bacterium]
MAEPSPSVPASAMPELPFDWRGFLFRLLRNWYWFVAALALCLGLAWVYLRYAVPTYNVSSTILIQNEQNQRALTEAFITEQLGFESNFEIEDEIQLLKSRSLMRRVVDTLHLLIQYQTEGRVKTSEVYPSAELPLAISLELENLPEPRAFGMEFRIEPLDERHSDQFVLILNANDSLHARFGELVQLPKLSFRVFLNDSSFFQKNIPHIIRILDPEEVARGYANRLMVQQIGHSNVLAINLVDPIPEKAIDIQNALAELYRQSIVDDKNKVGKQTLRFIDERLHFITEELYGVEKEVELYKKGRQLPVELSMRAQKFLEDISSKDQALAELDMRLSLLANIERFFATDSNYLQPLPVASEIITGDLAAQVQQYNEMTLRLQNLLEGATPDNPSARARIRELEDLRRSILLSVSMLRRESLSRQKQLQELLRPLETQMSLMPQYERELIQIMRQQQIKENLFLFLLQKREETALSVAAQVGNSRVIDRAANTGLVAPKHTQTYLFAFLLGLILPALSLYLIALFKHT